jgi:CheY-like chemotaxis protein
MGFAQILLRTARSAEDRAALETIHREAGRAARIIRDLLTFARRQGTEGREPLDVNEVVGYIISTRRYVLETRGVRLDVSLGDALPPVSANRSQLEQVVLNLLVNAEQALDPAVDAPHVRAGGGEARRGTITVRTSARADAVVLELADDGSGIAPEDLPRIWDPFFTTKQEGEGTGLGLSVVHGIVASLGGTIDVASAPGAGTRFTIVLPRLAAARDVGEPSLDAAARGGERAATPLDILVVDDEAGIVSFLERYLTSRGHAVLTASDGATALRLAGGTTFDVVVCDVRMPGMDGYEVVRRMRALPDGARTRYVLSTGANVDGTIPKADDLGVAAVVPKPYDIELLRRAIEEG